ncbi:MAG: hypothetical protein PWQ10_660 [Patescibacteria group bacterium]|nr:hypothetical protein [Patescibacteria group bacterium]
MTTVIVTPLVGIFIQPYIEVRKNRITKERANRIEVIVLIKSITSNLFVVLDEAKNKEKKLLIPTMVSIVASRLDSIESDAKDLVRLLVHLGVYHPSLKNHEDKFIRDVAHIAGGAVKIKSNVTKNTDKSINGQTGFRDVNVRTMNGYIGNLKNILEEVEHLGLKNRIKRKFSKIIRMKKQR